MFIIAISSFFAGVLLTASIMHLIHQETRRLMKTDTVAHITKQAGDSWMSGYTFRMRQETSIPLQVRDSYINDTGLIPVVA